jgi:hypothetical protein
MATGSRDFRATIGYSYDPAGERAFVTANQRLVAELDKTRKQQLSVEQAAESMNKELANIARAKAIDQIALQARAAAIETGRWRDGIALASRSLSDVGASEAEIKRVTKQIADAAQETNLLFERYQAVKREIATTPDVSLGGSAGGIARGDVGGGGRGRLGQLGTQLFLLPDISIPGLPGGLSTTELSRGMILADTAMVQLGVSATALATGLGLVGGAAIVFGHAIGEVQKELEEAKAAADRFAQRTATNADLIASGATTPDVTLQRDRIREALGVVNEEVEALVTRRDRLRELRFTTDPAEVEEFNRLFQEVSAIVGSNVTDFQALQEAIDAVTQKSIDYGGKLFDLNSLLASGELAANDAAEAFNRLANATIKAAQAEVQQQVEFNRLARTGTSEGVREQVAANEDLANALNSANERLREQADAAAAAGQTDAWLTLTDQIKANVEEIINLGNANDYLLKTILPVIEAHEREAKLNQGLTDAMDEYLEAIANEVKAREAIQTAQQAIDDELTKFADKQDEIATTLAEAEAKAEKTRQEALEELETDAGEKRIKNAENLAKRLAKIERDFARSFTQAVGDRDALAAQQAKQQREDAIKDLQDGQVEQEETIQKSLEKQRKVIEKRYKEQLDAALDAANKATRLENQRHDRELAIRRHAYDQAQVALQNAMSAQVLTYRTVESLAQQTGATVRAEWVNIQQAAATGMEFVRQTIQNNLMAAAQQVRRAPIQYSSPIGPQLNTIGSGFTPVNQNPFVSANQSFGGSGRTTLNVNFNGASVRQVDVRSRQQATRVLEEFWDQVPLR